MESTLFLDKEYNKVTIHQRRWHIENDLFEIKKCEFCGKNLNFYLKTKKYNSTCGSRECRRKYNSNPELIKNIIQKRKETNLKKYGTISKLRGEKWNEVRLATSKKLYKNSNYNTFYTREELIQFYDKNKNDILLHHFSPQLQQILQQTSFLNEYYSDIKIGQRIWHIKNNIFELQYCKTCKKLLRYQFNHAIYGMTCSMQCLKEYQHTTEFISKRHRTNLQRYGVREYCTSAENKKMILKNSSSCTSKLETEVYNILKTCYKGEISRNNYSVLFPYELDFYLPELNIALEVNGDYWHKNPEIYGGGENKRDYNKFLLAKEMGITLFTIWEKDIKKYKKCVKNFIKNALLYKSILSDIIFLLEKNKFSFEILDKNSIKVNDKILQINSLSYHVAERTIKIQEEKYKREQYQFNKYLLNKILNKQRNYAIKKK